MPARGALARLDCLLFTGEADHHEANRSAQQDDTATGDRLLSLILPRVNQIGPSVTAWRCPPPARSRKLGRAQGSWHRQAGGFLAPEDAGGVAVDLGEEVVDGCDGACRS